MRSNGVGEARRGYILRHPPMNHEHDTCAFSRMCRMFDRGGHPVLPVSSFSPHPRIRPCGGRLRPPRRAERRWVGAVSRCRGAVCADRLGASSSAGSTVRLERAWCPPRALSRLARDICPWQAVVAVGVEVHLWRVEVQLGDCILVRARPRPASPRAPPHRLCPAERRRRLLRCRQLQITDAALPSTCACTEPRGRPPQSPWSAPRSRASLRQSAARSSPRFCSSRSSRCCRWCCRLPRGGLELQGGAHGSCGGVARQLLSLGGSGAPSGRFRRLWRVRAARLWDWLPLAVYAKSGEFRCVFSRHVCASVRVPWAFLTPPAPLCMRVCVV